MRAVFFDSWAWISIANPDDTYHAKAVEFYKEYLEERNVPVTSDFVMAEVFTGDKHFEQIGMGFSRVP